MRETRKKAEMALSLADKVAAEVEDMMKYRCPGEKLCTACRARIAWVIMDALEGRTDGGAVEA